MTDVKDLKAAPLVSVVVLTRNQEHTIGRALDSIMAQNVSFDIEIVVSDDDSSDSTRAVVEQMASGDSRIRLLEKRPRKGLIRNYFDTLSACRGRYIADCSGDDYWLGRDSLQHKVDAISSDDRLSIVFTDWLNVDASDSKATAAPIKDFDIASSTPIDGSTLIGKALQCWRSPLIHLSTALYRRDLLMESLSVSNDMIDNESFGSEDLPVVCALLGSGSAMKLDCGPTLAYTVGGDSVSAAADLSRQADYFGRSAKMISSLADYYGVGRLTVKRVVSDKLHHAMRCAYGAKDIATARRLNSLARELGCKRSFEFLVRHALIRLIS